MPKQINSIINIISIKMSIPDHHTLTVAHHYQ